MVDHGGPDIDGYRCDGMWDNHIFLYFVVRTGRGTAISLSTSKSQS